MGLLREENDMLEDKYGKVLWISKNDSIETNQKLILKVFDYIHFFCIYVQVETTNFLYIILSFLDFLCPVVTDILRLYILAQYYLLRY